LSILSPNDLEHNIYLFLKTSIILVTTLWFILRSSPLAILSRENSYEYMKQHYKSCILAGVSANCRCVVLEGVSSSFYYLFLFKVPLNKCRINLHDKHNPIICYYINLSVKVLLAFNFSKIPNSHGTLCTL